LLPTRAEQAGVVVEVADVEVLRARLPRVARETGSASLTFAREQPSPSKTFNRLPSHAPARLWRCGAIGPRQRRARLPLAAQISLCATWTKERR
jgi:hypothetical protein